MAEFRWELHDNRTSADLFKGNEFLAAVVWDNREGLFKYVLAATGIAVLTCPEETLDSTMKFVWLQYLLNKSVS